MVQGALGMDRRSWLWRRRSSEKSPVETESSASASSLSERFSDEQDVLRVSPKYAQSPEISSKVVHDENNEKVKALNERLSAAVLDVRTKDDLVKQHSKVAEEAVLGWEKAEKEIAALKTQLNAATLKNSTLEDRIGHLDGALKECVRQLRRAREEQEQTVHDALAQRTRKWESEKTDLELQVIELKAKLEAKCERSMYNDNELNSKLSSLEKENSALKFELLARSEELQLRTIEKELSTRSAETASKQHLESIKKVAKLKAECRRLQADARRSSFSIEFKRAPSSVYAESVTDCQSECSDSWASALVTELDQFKNGKNSARSVANVDIGLMDDFLEMERLASVSQAEHENSGTKSELEDARNRLAKLEEKVKKLAAEKADREKALHEAQRELRISRHQSAVAEEKSAELQRQLNLVNGEKHAIETETEALEVKRNELETKLELGRVENANFQDKVRILEERIEAEKALTMELAVKYQHTDALEAERNEMRLQLEASHSEVKKLSDQMILLERKLEEEKAFSARLAAKCHSMEALEAQKNRAEVELESAKKQIRLLELKVEEEKALSAEFASRYQHLEALGTQRKELESRLEAANFEVTELSEKVNVLERTVEEEKALSSELRAKCSSLDTEKARRKELESQLESAQVEIKNLKENVSLLEKKLDNQKNLSAVYTAALDASELQKSKLMSQIELGDKETEELRGKLSLLEEQVRKESALSSEFAAKCRNLEDQLSRPLTNGDLQIKQEKELARAAGKFAECQKTIASLNRQLKSLASCDDFLLEIENDGTSPDDWDGDLKLLNSAKYSEHLGCLAVT